MKSIYTRIGKAISYQLANEELKKNIAEEIKKAETIEEIERILTRVQIDNNLILPERVETGQPIKEIIEQLVKNILLADQYMSCAALEKKYFVKPTAIRQAIRNKRFSEGEYYKEGTSLMISEMAFIRAFQKYLKSARYLKRVRGSKNNI